MEDIYTRKIKLQSRQSLVQKSILRDLKENVSEHFMINKIGNDRIENVITKTDFKS